MTTRPIGISKEVPVATVYSVNNFDTPRIQSLLTSLPQACTEDEGRTLHVSGRQDNSREPAQQSNLDEANIGQLWPTEKEAPMGVLK